MGSDQRRIYHLHVRKTAGTSLNSAFWALGNVTGARERWTEAEGRGLRFARHDAALIEGGNYFFASSHIPAHVLTLPPSTYTVTILRDPVSRVISYYRYLLWAKSDGQTDEIDPFVDEVRKEGEFLDGNFRYLVDQLTPRRIRAESSLNTLGVRQFVSRIARLPFKASTFQHFLDRVPPRKLLTQLQMFSKRMDPDEAAERVLACDAICFTETFSHDLAWLGSQLDLPLEERRERRIEEAATLTLTSSEQDALRERLEPEYRMIEQIQRARASG